MGCLAENDNEASEAKYTPDVPSEFDKKEKKAWVLWIETEEDGYEDMIIMVGLDKKIKKSLYVLSILTRTFGSMCL